MWTKWRSHCPKARIRRLKYLTQHYLVFLQGMNNVLFLINSYRWILLRVVNGKYFIYPTIFYESEIHIILKTYSFIKIHLPYTEYVYESNYKIFIFLSTVFKPLSGPHSLGSVFTLFINRYTFFFKLQQSLFFCLHYHCFWIFKNFNLLIVFTQIICAF